MQYMYAKHMGIVFASIDLMYPIAMNHTHGHLTAAAAAATSMTQDASDKFEPQKQNQARRRCQVTDH